jgi:hypothetical protein
MASTRRTTTTRTTTRETRATSRIGDDAAEGQEIVEVKPGLGLAEAAVFATTALLLAAIVLTDMQLGKFFGSGLFFK